MEVTLHIPDEVAERLTAVGKDLSRRALEALAFEDPALAELDAGERAAILLAEANHAHLLLIDERAGAFAARQRGLTVTGTLGVLDLASEAGLVDLKNVSVLLQKTNFRYPPSLMETLLEQDKKRKK